MNLNKKTLVGVTGATTKKEVEQLVDIFKRHHTNGTLLLNGILINANAEGYLVKDNKRYPQRSIVKELLPVDDRVVNILHITKADDFNLAGVVAKILGDMGDNWQGIQLNVPWPSIDEMRLLRKQEIIKKKDPFIILQVDSSDFAKANTPKKLARQVVEYDRFIHHLLLDASGGRGVDIDEKFICDCICEIRKCKPKFSIGIAGGLDGDGLLNLEKVIKHHKVSFDAADKLRCPQSGKLHMGKVEDYIAAADLLIH